MCHSVEMYLPKITRDAAEQALRGADRAAVAAAGPRRPGLLARMAAVVAETLRRRAVAR